MVQSCEKKTCCWSRCLRYTPVERRWSVYDTFLTVGMAINGCTLSIRLFGGQSASRVLDTILGCVGVSGVSTCVRDWYSMVALCCIALVRGVRQKMKFGNIFWLHMSARNLDSQLNNYTSLVVLQKKIFEYLIKKRCNSFVWIPVEMVVKLLNFQRLSLLQWCNFASRRLSLRSTRENQ